MKRKYPIGPCAVCGNAGPLVAHGLDANCYRQGARTGSFERQRVPKGEGAQFPLRCSKEQKARWEAAAERDGKTPRVWACEALDEKARASARHYVVDTDSRTFGLRTACGKESMGCNKEPFLYVEYWGAVSCPDCLAKNGGKGNG